MLVTINVTQSDIDRGSKGDCRRCPIALAILRVVKPGVELTGGLHFVLKESGKAPCLLRMPAAAFNFMDDFDFDFDERDCGRPFAFPIEIPDHFLVEEEVTVHA